MDHTRKTILKQFVLLTLILLYSCGASHDIVEEVIYRDASFSYNHLKKNEVAIGGIASQQIFFTDVERMRYSSLLSTILIEQLKDVHNINIINTSQLMQRIGQENYFDLMKDIDVEQRLIDEAMKFLKDEIPEIEYMIIATIENENIIDRSNSERIKDETGEDKYETDYNKTYFITVKFQIYDLFKEKIIWNILMYNKAERSETRTTDTGCVESCVSGAINSILFGSPAEISREEVLSEIFKKFAEKLANQ